VSRHGAMPSVRSLVRRLRGRAALLVACVGLSACGSEPSGGGMLSGSVLANGEGPGAVLLQFSGPGLIGAEGTGGTMAWVSEPVAGSQELRVLLVDPETSGALTFDLEVRDLSAPLPTITVLQLAGRDNVRFSTEDLEIRIRK
jgi:hypothetical protein